MKDNYKVEDEWSNPLPWISSLSCVIHIFWLGMGSTSWMWIPMLAAVCPLPPVSFQENISGVHLFSCSWCRGIAGLSLLYLLIGSMPRAFKFCGARKCFDLETETWKQLCCLLSTNPRELGGFNLLCLGMNYFCLSPRLLMVKQYCLAKLLIYPQLFWRKTPFLVF